ncbi:MAG: LPS assembly protein LptD, partial [Rhodospirillales bacterium]
PDTPRGNNDNLVPAKLSADSMTYDRDLGLIIAAGHVEIEYGGRSLLADKVTYNQKTDVVLAEGNASMTDETGKILFGDRMEITGDLKDGVIHNIGLILEDKSRIAGSGARHSNGTITETSNAVYSPCNLCADDPSAAPLWQLKAVRVIHDSEQKQVSYRNAWLELYGIPVAYTPYLSHPDPTVKRRSGFLAPSIGSSSDLGTRIFAPYYWAIDEYQDATLTPMLSSDGGQGIIGEYRRNFKNGIVDMNGSFVGDDPDRGMRGYVDFESEFHLNKTWRAGLDVETASDDTYTRRYGFNTEPVLETRSYIEGFRSQNYQVLNAYSFKDLRQDANLEESPLIIPMYDFNYSGKRDKMGGFAAFDFNALNLYRQSGTDTRRLAFRPRWDRPFSGPFGELYNASVSLAADAYHAENVVRDDGSQFTGSSARAVPRASLSWRLPLIRPGENFSQTIEPLASFVAAPNGRNSDKIPNEDSQEIEFDETNLFQDNRYDGFDRVDRGMRFNYGVNWVLTGNKHGSSSVFLGQSYRPAADTSSTTKVGAEENFSDYVGRIQISPHKYMNLLYRTQFSPDNFTPQRNEVMSNLGSPALRLSTNYIFIDRQQGSEFAGREEIYSSLSSKVDQNWSASFNARHDLSAAETRSLGLQVVYEDECVRFTTRVSRSFFEDRDLRPSDSITFSLLLKTLGEVHTGASISQ